MQIWTDDIELQNVFSPTRNKCRNHKKVYVNCQRTYILVWWWKSLANTSFVICVFLSMPWTKAVKDGILKDRMSTLGFPMSPLQKSPGSA